MDKKLDLSRLTDEEAKHVWEVIQRDFELRKKEEARLGELKTKIEKEDSKRELLSSQSNLTSSHCIRCLQPFKFLVNSKRQCLDCHFYICKTCSRYSTKEHGWVCDPCRMSRVLKVGTLGWYHDNIRSRFKRFGSAKVMRSLYKRLNEEGRRDDDVQSMPDVHNVYNGHDEEHMDATEAQRYKQMRKTKRLLSVHPMDLDIDEYGSHSRRQSMQYIQDERGMPRNDLEYSPDMYHHHHQRMNRRKSLDRFSRPDDGMYSEHRIVRARSLSKISAVPQRSYYMDTSEEEDANRFPVYQLPSRRRSRASSQENITHSTPPINELNKRMYAIESLLSRLEEKMTLPNDQQAHASVSQLEEEKLKKKLDELMSDRALSTDEDEPKKPTQPKGVGVKVSQRTEQASSVQEAVLSSSSDEMPTEAQKVYLTAGKSFDMEKKLRKIEHSAKNHYSGPLTDSELSELEDQLAATAAKVQDTESEVSDIENKIAVLSASGLSIDKDKKKVTTIQKSRKSQDITRVHF
ncbi:melanophilin a isoform X3 [Silurus meridionalis]|uniref:melanophilin a isoform X3 n=1 Tax=Silurus meridionalis TaxID=175797 RepID=UPI001EEAD785|nr:melanophilin a isoform X3 [Silurus meridionalis]